MAKDKESKENKRDDAKQHDAFKAHWQSCKTCLPAMSTAANLADETTIDADRWTVLRNLIATQLCATGRGLVPDSEQPPPVK